GRGSHRRTRPPRRLPRLVEARLRRPAARGEAAQRPAAALNAASHPSKGRRMPSSTSARGPRARPVQCRGNVPAAMPPALAIEAGNARTHHAKGIDCRVPHRRVTVVTGPSGAGKSSLAFDTVFAEGQRRFVESMSTYARQFLSQMERPPIDGMRNVL